MWAVVLIFGSCAATDVVGSMAIKSFDGMTQALGNNIALNQDEGVFGIRSPDSDVFRVAQDFNREITPETPDFELEFAAQPFLDAGLNGTLLAGTDSVQYLLEGDKLMIRFEWAQVPFAPVPTSALVPQTQLLETFKQILANFRDKIGYHEKLDHYGISLGDGHMFEWAKDLLTNDKDMVFILNPEPLIKAGLDPTKVKGWVFAKVEILDGAGKTQFVDKLLKPFDVK